MSESCSHDCSSCAKTCGANQKDSMIKSLAPGCKVKKVIAVASGKGGVGKSSTCALLAALAQKKGYTAAVLDADITGPSIPALFGLSGVQVEGNEKGILPVRTKSGIQVMSVNLLLEDPAQPVLWRGSMIAGAALQFWTDVLWQDVDYMFVDMPPGTGDVPLSVFQSLPLAGIVMVATPQALVQSVVEKAVNMAKKMDIPILGLVENMSYYVCPCCGAKSELFSQSKAGMFANEYALPCVVRMPLDPALTALSDGGKIEEYPGMDGLSALFEQIEKA